MYGSQISKWIASKKYEQMEQKISANRILGHILGMGETEQSDKRSHNILKPAKTFLATSAGEKTRMRRLPLAYFSLFFLVMYVFSVAAANWNFGRIKFYAHIEFRTSQLLFSRKLQTVHTL